ncbi:MAG: Crotonobetainyl-CoA:carnitine CoA-transferase CaiB [Chloroflexi bacterium]|jgi:crotonobetainyl-CoA:carnitine CoA-transferase CaiB-like acyl-CoA transferase|nr:MAG: Crotonobetainyl-CoA:carnitine CoA-transferase CaiB [Chloroflexota bacterium]
MGIMDGIKVVELGVWVAGPAAAGMLADWGADVVKVEDLQSDPFRGALSAVADFSAPFDLDNRGKRALTIDWRSDEGAEIVRRLVDTSDVFISNLRPGGLALAGLDYETLRARNPRLIYTSITGYGLNSSEANRPAFDVGAFWSRSGIAGLLGSPDGEPGGIRPGLGDHTTATQALAGISAALYHREKTGEGQQVRLSLLRSGAYTIGWDITAALSGAEVMARTRDEHPNLLISPFRTADDRYMWLLMMQGDRFWPQFCAAVSHPEWEHDPRFRTLVDRAENTVPLGVAIDAVMATKTRDEWGAIFDREGVWWAPVQTMPEVLADPAMAEAGAWVAQPTPSGETRTLASPVDFDGTPWALRGPAPEFGQHTEEILQELDYDWDAIIAMKDRALIP